MPFTPSCRTLGVVPAPQRQRPSSSVPAQSDPAPPDIDDRPHNGHVIDGAGFDLASALATAEPETEPVPSGLPRRLVNRFEHLIHEVGKFGVVGVIAFMVDFSLFNLLLNPIGPLPAKTIATVISASVAFVGNRFWTWRHRPRSGLGREYGLYFLFNAVGLGIGLACLWLSHYGLGAVWPSVFQNRLADNVSSLGVGMVLGTLFRFWSYRRIVFRAHAPARNPGEM
jgi:putative flippase GtrA